MITKLAVVATGWGLVLAGWTPEGTVLVISAIATILIPAVIALVNTFIKLRSEIRSTKADVQETKADVKETKETLSNQDAALDRIETKLETKNQ